MKTDEKIEKWIIYLSKNDVKQLRLDFGLKIEKIKQQIEEEK